MYEIILLTLAFIGAVTTVIATIVLLFIAGEYLLRTRARKKRERKLEKLKNQNRKN